MKKIFFITLLFVCCIANAQDKISPLLMNEINTKSSDKYLNVNIYFKELNDTKSASKSFNKEKIDFNERVKIVKNLHKSNSEFSEELFINTILKSSKSQNQIKNLNFMWIVNVLNADVDKDFIIELSENEHIKCIDLNSPRYKLNNHSGEAQSGAEKSENSVEPGLKAINAHKLWEMGYTGKNIVFLSFDTGVEPTHPAIKQQYLGNNLPLDQCWYAFRNAEPADKSDSSHGTHTTGTVLGLDRNTNDTIGVAFNAKWIATDPIASAGTELLTPSQLLGAFQWALDLEYPPQVINNSWGYAGYGSFFCSYNPEIALLETLEVAGICSPFAAGNEGLNGNNEVVPMSIGFPAMLAFNEVNPMSVGALESNLTIAEFSSRGPSVCITEENSLQIKPEVCAPGVNIRSCIRKNDYAYYPGTSMACPHVAGALCLLAEAFPNASAYDLKYALYQTAIQLGTEREDNNFGRGLIDVYEAYIYLSETYTATPPINNDYNLKAEVIQPNKINVCSDDVFTPVKIKISNTGYNTVYGFKLSLYINNILWVDDSTLTEVLNSDENYIFEKEVPVNAFDGIKNTIYAIVKPVENIKENDIFDNHTIFNFKILKDNNIPYSVSFNDINDLEADLDWIIENPDMDSNQWELLKWGPNEEYKALGFDFLKANGNRKDYIMTTPLSIPDEIESFLNVTYSYQKSSSSVKNDGFFIEISTDCGVSYPYKVFDKNGPDLATVEGNASKPFSPVSIDQFVTVSIPLNDFKGEKITIRFGADEKQGSRLYIDNIFVNSTSDTGIKEITKTFNIYPNPNDGKFTIDLNGIEKAQKYQIIDVKGTIVASGKFDNSNLQTINLNLTAGSYTVKVFCKDGIYNEKIIIK